MAMSLHLLRPVILSTRIICRTPPRLCTWAHHKHYLPGGAGISSSFHQNADTSCEKTPYQYQYALRELCTTAAPKMKGGNERSENDIMSKIKDTKSADELLGVVDKSNLTAVEASFALNVFTTRNRSNSEGWRGKMSNDPRMVRLNEMLVRNARTLGSRNLVKSLLNVYRLKGRNKQAVVDALVPALRSKLRAMDIFSLSWLVCSRNMLSDNKHTVDLVYEAARVMELRRREMDDISPSMLTRLLQVTPHFSQSFKTFISDKVLESVDKFSFADVVHTTSVMAQLPMRSIAILRAITYQAIQQDGQWELSLVPKFLESLGTLSFHHHTLAQQMAGFLGDKSSEWTPSTVGTMARAYMLLRMPQPELFDALSQYALNNLADFDKFDLNRLLYAFGELGYKPRNEQVFYKKITAKLELEFGQYSDAMKVQIASALMLSEQLPEFILKDLLQHRENDTSEPNEVSYNDILLSRINAHARLACPDYSGPYLECRDLGLGASQGRIEQSVLESFQMAVGGEQFLKTSIWTNMGYKLDALVLMDGNNKPVVIDDYHLADIPTDNSQDQKPVPPEFQKIALLIWTPKEMLFEKDELTGRCNLQKKHLQQAGYKLMEVNFKQWNEARTGFQQLSLIKLKLAEVILGNNRREVKQ